VPKGNMVGCSDGQDRARIAIPILTCVDYRIDPAPIVGQCKKLVEDQRWMLPEEYRNLSQEDLNKCMRADIMREAGGAICQLRSWAIYHSSNTKVGSVFWVRHSDCTAIATNLHAPDSECAYQLVTAFSELGMPLPNVFGSWLVTADPEAGVLQRLTINPSPIDVIALAQSFSALTSE
jgi:hypothetical protein